MMKNGRKLLSFLLSLLMIAMTVSVGGIQVFSEGSGLLGDANADGFVTPVDARLALRLAAELETEIEEPLATDADQNGRTTASDARMLLRYSIGLYDLPDAAPAMPYTELPGSDDESAPKLQCSAQVQSTGMYLTVKIAAENMVGLETAALSVYFDPDKLELQDIHSNVPNAMYACAMREGTDNCIAFGAVYVNQAVSDSEFCMIIFKILQNDTLSVSVQVNDWTGTPVPKSVVVSADASSENLAEKWLQYDVKNGEATVVSCDKNAGGRLTIPDTYEGCPVTAIGDSAFANCDNLNEIVIPASVTAIGESAFAHCSKLRNITLPDGLTQLGDAAFQGCGELKSISVPDGVRQIGDYTFMFCDSLTEVSLPDGLTAIGSSAFVGCSDLKEITIPNSVTTIGEAAFDNCTALTSVTVPGGVKTIAEALFYNCKSLESVTLPYGITRIGENAFYGCGKLASISIPSSVSEIGESAFYGCSSLRSVVIPNGVKQIRYATFWHCSSLEQVTIPESVTEIGGRSFGDCYRLTGVSIPASVQKIASSAFMCEDAFLEEPYFTLAVIYGESGSAAELYAKNNGIRFSLESDKPVDPSKLSVSDSNGIAVLESEKLVVLDVVGNCGPYAEDVVAKLRNETVVFVDRNGETILKDELVGTGSRIRVLDNNSNVLSEYTVLVPMDVNGDGKITAQDARVVLRTAARLESPDAISQRAADTDADVKITASDARRILRKAAHLE